MWWVQHIQPVSGHELWCLDFNQGGSRDMYWCWTSNETRTFIPWQVCCLFHVTLWQNRNISQKCAGISAYYLLNTVHSYILQECVESGDCRLKRLKLTMMDNVSLTRNIRTFGSEGNCLWDNFSDLGEIISSVETVILHDLCLGKEQWDIIADCLRWVLHHQAGAFSHWSKSLEILGSHWWTPYFAGAKVYAITTKLNTITFWGIYAFRFDIMAW